MPKKHLPYLDGMRGLAALYVVLHHAFLQSWSTAALQASLHSNIWLRPIYLLNYGHFAVTVFIAISGFCLTLPVLSKAPDKQEGIGRFFYRRARRILPPYYAAVIVASLLTLDMHHADLTNYAKSLPVTTGDLITHFLLIHNITDHYSKIAGPFWSIAVECQIYLFCPLIFLMLRRHGRMAALVVCFVLSGLSLVITGRFYHSAPPGIYFAVFGLGMYFADAAVTAPARWFGRLSALATALTLVIFFTGFEHVGQMGKAADVILGVAAGAFMAYAYGKPDAKVAAALSHRWVVALGLISYSLYLLHFPLLEIFWEHAIYPFHLAPGLGFTIVATLGVAVILLCSFVFYWIFERPFTTAGNKKAAKKVFEQPVLSADSIETISVQESVSEI